MESGFEVNSFYGKRPETSRSDKSWQGKIAKLENRAQTYKFRPVRSGKRQRISTPLPVFKTFPRQQIAFDFAEACYQDVHIFAEEKGADGKRGYVVATLVEFWSKYSELPILERHYYEVIPQGAACRLYFDLEFKTDLNPTCSGSDMVNIFIKYVCHCLITTYNIKCDRSCVLDLDSSTSIKFSRHLIFHLPDAVFKDNIHAGNFVRHICSLLVEKLRGLTSAHSDKQHKQIDSAASVPFTLDALSAEEFDGVSLGDLHKLSILDVKGELAIFVDEGVYTKNRNFRLYLSTKKGKDTPLTIGQENCFKSSSNQGVPDGYPADLHYQVFLDSLISNISARQDFGKLRVLTFEDTSRKPVRSTWRGPAAETSAESSTSGYEHSPYPQIDQFISRNIAKGGVQGQIRRWVYFPQGKLITYDIVKNHWCENIGRAHKSNHIMMVVDLKLGVYYQKCHDPDCKKIDFRSQSLPIPDEINPFHLEQLVGKFFEDGEEDDVALYRAAAQSEESYHATSVPKSAELCSGASASSSDHNHVSKSFPDTPPDYSSVNHSPLSGDRTGVGSVSSPVPGSVGCDILPSGAALSWDDFVPECVTADASRESRDSVLVELSDSELLDCLVETLDDDF